MGRHRSGVRGGDAVTVRVDARTVALLVIVTLGVGLGLYLAVDEAVEKAGKNTCDQAHPAPLRP